MRAHRGLLCWPARHRLAAANTVILFAVLCPVTAKPLFGQTFVQLTDMGDNVGPRLTRSVTRARINRSLFGRIGTKVSYIENGTVYQFASDPDWGRVAIGLWEQYVHAFTNGGGPGGALGEVLGIDISARKNVYIVDRTNSRLVVATFDPNARNLVTARNWAGSFPAPVDVAWDGQTSPLTTDFLYAVDDSLNSITYWNLNSGAPGTLVWSYGTTGSGSGQFLRPTGVCAGKTAASNGGTQFSTYFYVVDRGNKRVVWLDRASGPVWVSSVKLAGWDPADCAVDAFGNLYIVDRANHHIYKFTNALSLLATYGTFGMGASNLNTLAWPHAISVPCGLKVVNSQTVWYCEGRIITAEQWSDSSGAVEHYLGIDGAITAQPQTDSWGDAWFSYSTTDHGTHRIYVVDQSGNYVRTISYMGILPPGVRNEMWDGQRDDGTPAPAGTYWFQVLATSVYGCSGQSWCAKGLATQSFYHVMSPNCSSGPCSPPVGGGSDGSAPEPTSLFLRQRVLLAPRPLARLEGAGAGASELSAGPSGSLRDAVRQYGVRGLSFGVTRDAASTPLTIRVVSMSGRLVRVLVNEQVSPGFYEVGWDGNDDHGRPASPGVYVAVMTIGSYRATQHLILRQP